MVSHAPSPPAARASGHGDALQGWGRVCHRELTVIFDAAHEGLHAFVTQELAPWPRNFLRALDLRTAFMDAVALGFYAADRRQGYGHALILPSEQDHARAFARWCLGTESVELFLARTFDLVGDALARKHGHAMASELVEDAVDRFEPVRREVVRRLLTGPSKLRPALWPTRYLAAPALWGAAWLVFGGRQPSAERVAREVVVEALGRLGQDTEGIVKPPHHARRLALAGLLCVVGATLGASALYRALDTSAIYQAHLEDLEDLLLFGAPQRAPQEVHGPGLLTLLAELEAWRPS